MNAAERKSLLHRQVRKTLQETPPEKFKGRDAFDVITSSKRNIPIIGELLSDGEPTIRAIAAACLCRLARNGGDIRKFRPKLEELMKSDPDETVRMHASFLNSALAKAES